MQIIITMAGESSRFYKEGFTKPKYELLLQKQTMFAWSLRSLKAWFSDYPFYFIAKKGASTFIQEQCAELGIVNHHIIELASSTRGQAETVLACQPIINSNEALLIYNIDTYVNENTLSPSLIQSHYNGWIPAFPASGTHWSFIALNAEQQVLAIKEKERISSWGTIGLYYFSSFDLFLQAYQYQQEKNSHGEAYIAPLYDYLLHQNKPVYGYILPASAIVPLGTPAEALLFDPRFYEVNKHG